MNHTEQRVWLIKELQKNPSQLSHYPIPKDEQEQKDLLRGLMNIWEPKELSEEYIKIQDEYLTEESIRNGITDIAEENGVKSIALCCISTGVFMFPNQRAAEIAVETVKNWLDESGSQMKVVFNVFKDIDLEIYDKLLNI